MEVSYGAMVLCGVVVVAYSVVICPLQLMIFAGLPVWLQQQHQQQVARPVLHSRTSFWMRVDGKLTTLQYSGCDDETSTLKAEKGFRRFVVLAANNLGITGFIQRRMKSDVEVFYEGTDDQMERFEELLSAWLKQELVGEVKVNSAEEGYVHRRYTDFGIHRNFTNLASARSRHGIINGDFSDDLELFEKQSVSSADTMEAR